MTMLLPSLPPNSTYNTYTPPATDLPTPLDADALAKVVEALLAEYHCHRQRLEDIASYMDGDLHGLYVPKTAEPEYRLLVDQSKCNILPLVETAVAQALFVDGYRPISDTGRAPSSDNSPIWDLAWQANRMDARQSPLYRNAIRYGYSYATGLPGTPDVANGAPVITPYSPRTLTALYDDPVNDEWPQYAMICRRPLGKPADAAGDVGTRLTILDTNYRYEVNRTARGWELTATAQYHGLGVVPVVRYLDQQSTDRLPVGKIQPLFPAQRQLNQITFGLAMALQFTAFAQRWVTGMTDERPNFKVWADAMLAAESPDSRFGQFAQTDVGGYLEARDKVLLFVASVAQIPPHNLLVGAGISNISAEALTALEAGHRQDIEEHQTSFGESHEQLLRLCGKAVGGEEGQAAWEDTSAQVVWRDTTPRSLAQVADALGKLATQLGIPVRALWEMVPGVTDQDLERWESMADEGQLMDNLRQMVERNAATSSTAPTAVKLPNPSTNPATSGPPVATPPSNGSNPPTPR